MTGYVFAPEGNLSSWIDAERTAQLAAELPTAIADRYYRNIWTSASGGFINEEQMAAIVDPALSPTIQGPERWSFFAGLDFGRVVDSAAFAVLGRPDGGAGVPRLLWLQKWQASHAEPVSVLAIESAMVAMAERYPGIQILADPHELRGSLERWQQQGLRIEPYAMTASSVQRLAHVMFTAITGLQFRMYPHLELESEIVRLEVKQRPDGWRTDHTSGRHNDLSTALSLALECVMAHPWASLAQSIHFAKPSEMAALTAEMPISEINRQARTRKALPEPLTVPVQLVGPEPHHTTDTWGRTFHWQPGEVHRVGRTLAGILLAAAVFEQPQPIGEPT